VEKKEGNSLLKGRPHTKKTTERLSNAGARERDILIYKYRKRQRLKSQSRTDNRIAEKLIKIVSLFNYNLCICCLLILLLIIEANGPEGTPTIRSKRPQKYIYTDSWK